jgi:sulfonate transport system ATP-binding protein
VLVLEHGRVAHSITIESPRPTTSERTAKHDQYRTDLLDKLGVRH